VARPASQGRRRGVSQGRKAFGQFVTGITAGAPIDQWRILAKLGFESGREPMAVAHWLLPAQRDAYLRVGYPDAYLVVGDAAVKVALLGRYAPLKFACAAGLPIRPRLGCWPTRVRYRRTISAGNPRVGHSRTVAYCRATCHAKFLSRQDPLARWTRSTWRWGLRTDWQTRVIDASELELDATELKECIKTSLVPQRDGPLCNRAATF
jgi:hypothetical protein